MKKNSLLFFIAAALLLLSSRAFSQSSSPKENLKEFEGVQVYKPSSGYLTVNMNYSIINQADREEKVFQPYNVYDLNGKLYKNIAQSYFTPITITLPAGTYYIKSADINGEQIKFGVEIQAGKNTLVE